VALGILKVAKKDLLQQDFEGLMKYFRVNIPKTYRSEENAKHLMAVACAVKLKKLNKVSLDLNLLRVKVLSSESFQDVL
jgi:Rab GTPase-activating protein 1